MLFYVVVAAFASAPLVVPFSRFVRSCDAQRAKPLTRFWGSRPHPDLSMIAPNALWAVDDANLAVLPRWDAPKGATLTAPFVDTHVAVRFLGGVSNFSAATAADCTDIVGPAATSGVDRPGVWCDLVIRDPESRKLVSRFGLVNSRLDRYAHNGIDVMIVLDDVPWAFVNVTGEACKPFGCQYLPPDDPTEFGTWVGALAVYLEATYGSAYANRVQWRLGTEANGPRWGDRGKYYAQYLACYVAAMKAVKRVLPGARVGASNWVEVMRPGASGNFTPAGSDSFQYDFYGAVAADASIPLDWISISHYGGAGMVGGGNFPGADYVERTPDQSAGAVELVAMRARAMRPRATLEIQEWSILQNENGQGSWEPSSLGSAWAAASATRWMCVAGVDKIFHWESGTTIRNVSGRQNDANFYEQWAWDMALLELFIGGRPRFVAFDLVHPPAASTRASATSTAVRLNSTVAVIESAKGGDELYVLVAALGYDRSHRFRTAVQWNASANVALLDCAGAPVHVEQYVMNSSTR